MAATVSCVSQVALDFVGGGSDKVYVIQVQQIEDGGVVQYSAKGFYGRRGATLSETEKYKGPSIAGARAAADKLEREKRGKGYSSMATTDGVRIGGMPSSAPVYAGSSGVSSSVPAWSAPLKRAVVNIPAMLAKVVPNEAAMEALLVDPNYAVQKKYDGVRCVLSIRRGSLVSSNRNGESTTIDGNVAEEMNKLTALPDFSDNRETVLDGELLLGGVFVVYDLITLRDQDVRNLSFVERYAMLEDLLKDQPGLLAPTAWTEEEKREFLAKALAEEWEGIMFRNIDGSYISGRSADLLKYKLWATATCRVLTTNSQRSVQLALRDASNEEVFCGNVTVPINMDIPECDALVEVRYLYAAEGGSLYQPTLLQVRTDVDEADTLDSLRRPPAEKKAA